MSTDIASLEIVTYPAKVLRQKASAVAEVTAEVRDVAERMLQLMHKAEGVGLAAPQVGLRWRLFVAEVDDDGKERLAHSDPPSATPGPLVFINPKIVRLEGPPEPFEEGCLSLKEIRGEVLRPPVVTVQALDEHGKPFTARYGGLMARCVQHEIDHLDGVLILDRMTQISRMKTRSAVRDLEKAAKK